MLMAVAVACMLAFSPGCVVVGAYVAVKAVYGVAEKGDTVGMNYHAEPSAVWEAAQAQLGEMELTPTGNTELKKDEGELKAGSMTVRVAPLKKAPGARVDVVTDLDQYADVRQARLFLNGVAERLGEYDEAVQDFAADLKTTHDAAVAQLKSMGFDPGRGTLVGDEAAKIRISDAVIALEELKDGRTRVHVSLNEANEQLDLERASYLFAGMQERL